jgi:hypothetical protein
MPLQRSTMGRISGLAKVAQYHSNAKVSWGRRDTTALLHHVGLGE